MSIPALALALSLLAPAAPEAGAPLDLRLDAGWNAALGKIERAGEGLLIEGDPENGQAVVLWQGLGIDASRYRYVTVEHGGLAPRQALSLYVRTADGEHAIDIPETARSATVALTEAAGWRGTVSEVGLVLGPQGNIPTLGEPPRFELRRLRMEPAGAGAAWRERATRALRITGWTGLSINVLPGGMLTAAGGAMVFVAVLLAALSRGRRKRVALALLVGGLLVVELATGRQLVEQRRETAQVVAARDAQQRPRDLDWELVEFAARLRPVASALGPQTRFEIVSGDPFVAARLRYHLLPWRVTPAATAPGPDLPGCAIRIGDQQAPVQARALALAQTSFGPLQATVAKEDPECSSASPP